MANLPPLSWPDDLLIDLQEMKRGWYAYAQERHSYYLQGALAATPQDAIDAAVKRVRENRREIAAQLTDTPTPLSKLGIKLVLKPHGD